MHVVLALALTIQFLQVLFPDRRRSDHVHVQLKVWLYSRDIKRHTRDKLATDLVLESQVVKHYY